jgi:uncharacterized protein
MASVLWHTEEGGADRCTLDAGTAGFRLHGIALLVDGGAPVEARYAVDGDGFWRTRRADIVVAWPDRLVELLLEADGAGGWTLDGRRLAAVEGCIDVDLGFTPATNTLPLRRIELEVGEAAEVECAWLRFPELSVERSLQRYERVAFDRYRFSSGSFSAELDVDRNGLVLDYSGLWRALAHA